MRAGCALINVKQRLLGTGLMSSSFSARVMMVCIWPRKNLTASGLLAPGCDSISASTILSCTPQTLP